MCWVEKRVGGGGAPGGYRVLQMEGKKGGFIVCVGLKRGRGGGGTPGGVHVVDREG